MSRKRAVRVCDFCHGHKVRCDLDVVGSPCSKCIELGEKCNVRTRKPYPERKRALRSVSKESREQNEKSQSPRPGITHPELVKIVQAAVPKPSSRIAPIFIEEGGYGDILNAVGKTTDRYFHIPASAEEALAPEDLEYLRIKGCFTLPENSRQLIEAYFQYVHPTFPVIDAEAFLQHYAANGLEGINLLLLWSMFSISTSYVSASPQKAYKKMYASRAKLLFDLTPENDKIVLVQSALLLSFWFEDGEDVKQSWYWSSIAIGIAQTLGLHHSTTTVATQTTAMQRSLWLNIWYCCMYRDVWLAFGMGRPLRIPASDHRSASPKDLSPFNTRVVLDGEVLYSLDEAKGFNDAWMALISLTGTMHELMTKEKLAPSRSEKLQARLAMPSTNGASSLLTRVQRHSQLHENAAIVAMGRKSGSKNVVMEAADRTTTIIQALLDDQTSAYAAPIVIPLLVPAMVTYLHLFGDGNSVTSKSAKDKLFIYSQFLTALEANYPAASILKGIFSAAQDAMLNEQGAKEGKDSKLTFVNQFVTDWSWHTNDDLSWQTRA
ncbi:fungal-specific transcription factor domain-containing protein [Paraphoma chrysanthemicola]|uniref:Fungal-specific transcription factor domain-containing protein n=1 Tax=Paraphoma chrysanthemicola TaxID=798071 RepID=A0A8K0QV94_9PLEO|nr:fungal-specific transcription factor domain-containing protein [Paraphoma chrysanthemicola]